MISRWQPMYYYKIFVCFILAIGVFHPLWTVYVQADETNKSVLDGYLSPSGQAPVEVEKSEIEGQISTDELTEVSELLPDQNLFGMFFQLFLALAVIILMIYALIRFIGKRSQSYQTHRTLQNIGGVHVGSNRSIQLVRVGERVLVVGVGETIQLLKEIDDENEVRKIIEENQVDEAQQQFSSLVNWVQTKLNGQGDTPASKTHFKGLLERQLTDVKNSQKQAHAAIKEREQ